MEHIRESSRAFAFLLVFMLIFLYGESFWVMVSGNSFIRTAYQWGMLLIPTVLFLMTIRMAKDRNSTLMLLAYSSLLLLSVVYHSDGLGGILVILHLGIAYLLVAKYEYYTFLKTFSDCILILTFWSVACYVFLYFHLLPVSFYENYQGATYSQLGGCVFLPTEIGNIMRNSGIFREPGLFMIYINLAFLFDTFIYKDRPIPDIRMIIYVLGIISTFSTAGYIIFLLLLFMYISQHRDIKRKSLKEKIMIMLLLMMPLLTSFNDVLFSKINIGNNQITSISRISSIIIPFAIMGDYPIFGCGTTSFSELYRQYGVQIYHFPISSEVSTNTIMNGGAIFGIWFSLAYILLLWLFASRNVNAKRDRAIVFLSLLMMFSNEVILYSPIPYILLFYGVTKKANANYPN